MRPVRGLRRIPLPRVWCPAAHGETYCWHCARWYRHACRRNPDLCPWEPVYDPGLCHLAH